MSAPADIAMQTKPGEERAADAQCVEIGIVNNMPDATLAATERQFKALIDHAAEGRRARVRFFALPGIARGEGAARHIKETYGDLNELTRDRLDGLIITGCEPKAASLADEPYWPSLTWLIDWAADHTRSTIFSCLAAHAAVLHLDGIKRVPVGRKYSGIFECAVMADDPLTRGLGRRCTSRIRGSTISMQVRYRHMVIALSAPRRKSAWIHSSSSAAVFLSSFRAIPNMMRNCCCVNIAAM